MIERHLIEELGNISIGGSLFPGNTISHETANECVRRGWAKRDPDGNFVLTREGKQTLWALAIPAQGASPETSTVRTG